MVGALAVLDTAGDCGRGACRGWNHGVYNGVTEQMTHFRGGLFDVVDS